MGIDIKKIQGRFLEIEWHHSLLVRTIMDSLEFSGIPVLVEHKIINILHKTGIIIDKNQVVYYHRLKNSEKKAISKFAGTLTRCLRMKRIK